MPPQDIKAGRIRVNVIEGYIAEFVLMGDDVDRYWIRKPLGRVTEERPFAAENVGTAIDAGQRQSRRPCR